MTKLHITVPVDGYGDTPAEVEADCMAKAAKVFGCDPGELEITSGSLDLMVTATRPDQAGGKRFWADARVSRKYKVTEIVICSLGKSESPMVDTLTLLHGFLEVMSGKKPEVSELFTDESTLTTSMSVPTPSGSKLTVTVSYQWPPEHADGPAPEPEASHG
jgi:hypothetical protein